MIDRARITLACLLAALPLAGAPMVVNTRLHLQQQLDPGESLQLELRDFFRLYEEPGPVATFHLHTPVQDGIRRINGSGAVDENGAYQAMFYKLNSGGTYQNVYIYPDKFLWQDYAVQFQLLPAIAPVSVANFITYSWQGSYLNTIIHRSQIKVLQAGGFQLLDNVVKQTPSLAQIPFERTLPNTIGTLGMARQADYDTGTSQFFINLTDHTSGFGDEYTVFGSLIDFANMFPLLEGLGSTLVFNLTSLKDSKGNYLFFPAFTNAPLYTPYYDDPLSIVIFDNIAIPPGNADGISYSWQWLGDQPGDPSAITVNITGSSLRVSRAAETGGGTLRVTGSAGGSSASFDILVQGYDNVSALAAFPKLGVLGAEWAEAPWFGLFMAADYPYIMHAGHGAQYLARLTWRDPYTGRSSPYYCLYDFHRGEWLYTTPSLYPHLYAYGSGKWLYYDTASGTFGKGRRFYDHQTGGWVAD